MMLLARRLLPLCALLLVTGAATARAQTNSAPANPGTNQPLPKWEKEIRALEAADRRNPPPANAVLFAGSSTIRLWTNLAHAFPGFPVLNRGFGGSLIADSTQFADRIIIPCAPRLIVLYAGDNDLANGHPPAQVVADYQAFVRRIRAQLPATKFCFLAIKPSPARWKIHDQAVQANAAIAAWHEPGLDFVDVYTPMLGADGQPRPELYQPDGLHPSPAGYELWADLIRPHLR